MGFNSAFKGLINFKFKVVNAFETWCWRRMLKIKWTDRIMNYEIFQRTKEERLLLRI